MQTTMIGIGNFFFRTRNRVFPCIIVALFALAVPPVQLMGSVYLENVKDMLAVALSFSGLAFRALVIGFVYIKRGGLNKKVYAENLVTEGIFGLCRNPLYVGNLLIYAGVFLMHGDPLVMVLGMGSYVFIYQCIVFAEEAYLLNKFGDGYHAYCREVPRWIPRFSKFREATEGMVFNFRRVVLKDYTTIASTTITLALTEGYEQLAHPELFNRSEHIFMMGCVIVAASAMAGIMRLFKKRKWLVENPV